SQSPAQRQQRERHGRAKPAVSKEALALLADLVYKQTEGAYATANEDSTSGH
ncbi:hypothetical protein BBJ28_00022499, partial [Nothophytophthora sp. Chile5]